MVPLMLMVLVFGGDWQDDFKLDVVQFEDFSDGMSSCFVLMDLKRETTARFNESRCAQQLAPCSTFKIFNALAALDAEVVRDADTSFRWDGKQKWNKNWERDHSLATAMKYSVVWYYQEVARRIGAEQMQACLDRVGYGNRDISGGIDRFWLGSSLKISANEQVEFLANVYRNDLPFSQHALDTTRNILALYEHDGSRLSGKTGSGWWDGGYQLGWFVGHLITAEGGEYVFAYNMTGKGASGVRAKAQVLALLDALGLGQFQTVRAVR